MIADHELTPISTGERPQAGSCAICGSASVPQFVKSGYWIHRCSSCDFLFVCPYPSDAELHDFYNKSYRDTTEDHYPKANSRKRRSRVRALSFLPYIFQKNVVELGCGGGFMSAAIAAWAKRVVGIDLSATSIGYAAKHFGKPEFRCQSMRSLGEQGEKFDFVFSSELFEHLPGVEEVMGCISRITHPGSLVYVSAPDASHAKTPSDLESWSDICPPEHLQWFGQKNLAQLFDSYGFDVYKFKHNKKPAHSALFRRR